MPSRKAKATIRQFLFNAIPVFINDSDYCFCVELGQLTIDDDQDYLWMQVRVAGSGAGCRVGYRSCFYRRIPTGKSAVSSQQPLKLTLY